MKVPRRVDNSGTQVIHRFGDRRAELLGHFISHSAQLPQSTPETPHRIRESLRSQHDEGQHGDDDQLAALQVEHDVSLRPCDDATSCSSNSPP